MFFGDSADRVGLDGGSFVYEEVEVAAWKEWWRYGYLLSGMS